MGYHFDTWVKRYAERSDLSTKLVHLTKEQGSVDGEDVMLKILNDNVINGSGRNGFIVGNTKAACFQDVPLTAVCQNCWYEQKYREKNTKTKVRYEPIGFLVEKTHVYRQGGRPVIYDKTDIAKTYLPTNEYWKIVNFDLDSDENIIDWTHEREWRVPDKFQLDLKTTVLLFANDGDVRKFIEKCDDNGSDVYKKVSGFVTMSALLY